jgi:hypothetical protein
MWDPIRGCAQADFSIANDVDFSTLDLSYLVNPATVHLTYVYPPAHFYPDVYLAEVYP